MRKNKRARYLVMAQDNRTLYNEYLGIFYKIPVAVYFARSIKRRSKFLVFGIYDTDRNGRPTRVVKLHSQI